MLLLEWLRDAMRPPGPKRRTAGNVDRGAPEPGGVDEEVRAGAARPD